MHAGVGMDAHAGEDSERLIDAPETMQPPETSDETAKPRRPSTSWTNFAGGVISA